MIPDFQDALRRARIYADEDHLPILGRDYGPHGVAYLVRDYLGAESVLKTHEKSSTFDCELAVYLRMLNRTFRKAGSLEVARLVGSDRDLRVLEMTRTVTNCVSGFSWVYMDVEAPEHSADVMRDWRQQKKDRFGEHWREVERALHAFKYELNVTIRDVNRDNFRFQAESWSPILLPQHPVAAPLKHYLW